MDGEGFEPLWLFPTDSPTHSTMDGEGFEPSKAVPTDLQSAPFGHSGIHPFLKSCLSRPDNIHLYHNVIQNARTFFSEFFDISKRWQKSSAILPVLFLLLPYILRVLHYNHLLLSA